MEPMKPRFNRHPPKQQRAQEVLRHQRHIPSALELEFEHAAHHISTDQIPESVDRRYLLYDLPVLRVFACVDIPLGYHPSEDEVIAQVQLVPGKKQEYLLIPVEID